MGEVLSHNSKNQILTGNILPSAKEKENLISDLN